MKFVAALRKRFEAVSLGEGIASIRAFLLESVIFLLFVLGFFAVIMGAIEVWLGGPPNMIAVYVGAYVPVAVCFFYRKKIPYPHCAGILLLDAYFLASWVLAGVGLSGAGLHLLTVFCIMTSTFLGIRMGLVSIAMSVGAILAVGVGMSTGIIPIETATMANSTRIEAWITAAVLFLIVGGIMVVCPGVLQNYLQRTIEMIRQQTRSLKDSNVRLKKAFRDREEMEARLIQSEKMEAMGLLAGGVAHDLNNILSGVTTYPELLLSNMEPDHEFYGHLKTIKTSGDKAAAIVRDLLTLSRRGVTVKEVIDLNTAVLSYFESPEYEKLITFHPGIRLATNFRHNLDRIYASPVHITTMVMNLISNAAEAMPWGGEIRVGTRMANLPRGLSGFEQIPAGDYVVLTVADQGGGITGRDLPRIFEPFFTKKKLGRSGTGLGMAIVMGTVRDHDAYIDVHTAVDKGTRFFLYFPVTEKAASPESADLHAGDLPRGNGESILFVDDVKEQRDLGGRILTKMGYAPVIVSSGEDAVASCRDNKPELIVLDMIMDPGMDGYETLKAVRGFYPDLPAVIVSGYSETGRVKSALAMGRAVFLKKPYGIHEIGIAVRNGLEYPH